MLRKDKFKVVEERGIKRAYYGNNKRFLLYKNVFINTLEEGEEGEEIPPVIEGEVDPEVIDPQQGGGE